MQVRMTVTKGRRLSAVCSRAGGSQVSPRPLGHSFVLPLLVRVATSQLRGCCWRHRHACCRNLVEDLEVFQQLLNVAGLPRAGGCDPAHTPASLRPKRPRRGNTEGARKKQPPTMLVRAGHGAAAECQSTARDLCAELYKGVQTFDITRGRMPGTVTSTRRYTTPHALTCSSTCPSSSSHEASPLREGWCLMSFWECRCRL